MKTAITIALATTALALAGCAPTVNAPETPLAYDCGDGIRLKVEDFSERVTVRMNDNPPVTLPAVPAASGAKYMSATYEFWSKGDEAMWTIGRRAPMVCRKVAVSRAM